MPDFWLEGGCIDEYDGKWVEDPETCENLWKEQN